MPSTQNPPPPKDPCPKPKDPKDKPEEEVK
jgi:hypothetical protein